MHDHDRGLAFDLPTLLTRRRALLLLGGAGVATLAGCSSDGDSTAASTTTTAAASDSTTSTAVTTSLTEIPDETGGPYPGDGSNGPNVLTESGVVRSDLRTSFDSLSGTAEGIPMTVTLTVLDINNGAAPLEGAAVYLWHCDREGRYSLYSQGATDQNYLRGVQVSDGNGKLTFTTVFPAAYMGRWPHMHFEVYPSLDQATAAGSKLKTSQLALPEDVCNTVYATSGYEASVSNMTRTPLESDNVFSDGWSSQMATVTGNVTDGYAATLNVAV